MSDNSLNIINNDTKRRSHSNTVSGGRPPALDIDTSRPTHIRRNSEGSPHLPPICVSEPTPIEPSVDNGFFNKVPTPVNSRPASPVSDDMDLSASPPPPHPLPKSSATAPTGTLLDSPKPKKFKTRSRGSSITSNLINEIKENPTIQNLTNKIKSRHSEDAETERPSVDGSTSVATSNISFANAKRNQDFHALFRSVPEDDSLIEDFGCALQKEILLQGRIYISENHLCFNANIFGWITNLVIAFADITEIEKKATAYFIPNAIQVSTDTGKHFFASFLSRDQAYDLIVDIWKNARPELSDKTNEDSLQPTDEISGSSDEDTDSYYDSDTEDSYSDSSSNHSEIANKGTQQASVDNNATRARQISLASLPAMKDDKGTEANRRRAMSELPKPSFETRDKSSKSNGGTKNDNNTNNATKSASTTALASESSPGSGSKTDNVPEIHQVNETTECECSEHYPTIVMDQTYSSTVNDMYNLLFHDDFMKKFLVENQKLTELSMGEWKKGDGSVLESRDLSYIKPLNGSIGPKSARCLITEEILHKDFDTFITALTTTSTPEVPSGGSFTCKTKTCITWAGKGKVRILVSVLVDFTKTSWFKSQIEKGSIEGQQTYYKDLDIALRAHLKQSNAHSTTSRHDGKKKRKGKKSKRSRSVTKPETKPLPEPQDSVHRMLGACSNLLADGITGLINIVRSPTSSHLTLLCLISMVFINIFIARKMAFLEKQLSNLGSPVATLDDMTESYFAPDKRHGRQYNRQEEQDLWDWLGHIDPDKSSQIKERINFPSQPEESTFDEAIQASKAAKDRLNKHMVELSDMIQKAESNLEQVTKAVKEQRQKVEME